MASSTAPPDHQGVATYCRRAKRARTGGLADPPRALSAGSPAADSIWRDWANLTAGPAGLIAKRLLADDVAGYLRFRAVCSSWRRCCASPHAHGGLDRRFHPKQWIMLPRTFGAAWKRRDLLNVSTGERIRVDLPELSCQYVFGPTSDGLVVLCDKRTYAVRLLNPLTRQLTGLPDATTLLRTPKGQRGWSSALKQLKVFGAGLADDGSTVALHFGARSLAVAMPGDEQWTRLHFDHDNAIVTTLSFASRFYCVTEKAIMVVDTTTTADQRRPPQLAVAAELGADIVGFKWYDLSVNLVDNDGELLLLYRHRPRSGLHSREDYEVCRVDLDAGKTVPTRGLGGRAVFFGVGHAGRGPTLSVPAGAAGLSPFIRGDAVYSCWYPNTLRDGRPRINVYLLVGGGNVLRGIDDARACGVPDYILPYVCRSERVMPPRRRSDRQVGLQRKMILYNLILRETHFRC